MEPDFSGWATKAGIKCSDGRTIMPNAFQHQDQVTVPLVWQHGHSDPKNVLGHALLENRAEGVYAYGYFNNSDEAQHAKGLVEHKDIGFLSIWANQLLEKSKNVLHGTIREVSLVLAGANPGAKIENITIAHSDGEEQILEDEALIYTGLELEHSSPEDSDGQNNDDKNTDDENDDTTNNDDQSTDDQNTDDQSDDENVEHGDKVVHAIGEETVKDVINTMDEKQKNVLIYLLGQATDIQDAAAHSEDDNDNNDADSGNQEGNKIMKHNVFEQAGDDAGAGNGPVISHDELKSIVKDAQRRGSLKHAFEEYALAHGIENIDTLFPDAKLINGEPDWVSRRVEWVGNFLGATRKSPFARIKTVTADITEEEARAKGYITGTLKREEFFAVNSRTTTPQTVYKKQKLDRDDVIDITDFDVVTWLKGEMRIMLDEEIARAALIGDGRDISSEDKISESNIRPIAYDNELYTTKVYVNIDDASSSVQEIIDAIVTNRHKYKGSGMPVMYTTETIIAKFLLLKDTTGRRLYSTLNEIAVELRCSAVVPVDVMEEATDLVAILVNPIDYVFGTDRGGDVNMFDDFDIDYNQLKYLIETRCSGALVKPKSAIAVLKTAGANVLAVPVMPTFNASTGVLSITNTTGVVYKNGATVVNAAGSPYAAIAPGASVTIDATPAAGYYFSDSDVDQWTFTREES